MPPPPPPPPAPKGKLLAKKKAFVDPFKKRSPPKRFVAPPLPAVNLATPKSLDTKQRGVRNRALGALFGASIGDSLGSYIEFLYDDNTPGRPLPALPTAAAIKKTLTMPGGGTHGVAVGQVTDDTEMACALASVLAGRDPRAGFPTAAVRAAYVAWVKSGPFDLGISTRAAFENMKPSAESQSNGSLMRASPIAVWARDLPDAAIGSLARADAALSHASPIAQLATGAYVIAMAALIRGEKAGVARKRAIAWLDASGAGAAKLVRSWITSTANVSNANSRVKAGWLKHAFRLAFFHLHKRSTFRTAVRQTLLTGGDTDTNACIVGAMIGARGGFTKLPPAWRAKVLKADTNLGRPRPTLYHPRRFVTFANGTFRGASASGSKSGSNIGRRSSQKM